MTARHLTGDPIQPADFAAERSDPAAGGVALFLGVVRDRDRGRPVIELWYEAYPEMADREIAAILDEARARWPLTGAGAVHRLGTLAVGDVAVAVRVEAPHREEAFAACRWIIDEIKRRVPIWKRQVFADGTSEWARCEHLAGP